jgi:transposase-like protein
VNANQVFKWRSQYKRGRLEVGSAATLLPVKITEPVSPQPKLSRKAKAKKAGVIDIDLGHARMRIEGPADPECVRAALEGLVR